MSDKGGTVDVEKRPGSPAVACSRSRIRKEVLRCLVGGGEGIVVALRLGFVVRGFFFFALLPTEAVADRSPSREPATTELVDRLGLVHGVAPPCLP